MYTGRFLCQYTYLIISHFLTDFPTILHQRKHGEYSTFSDAVYARVTWDNPPRITSGFLCQFSRRFPEGFP
jgi:hypothetical protein